MTRKVKMVEKPGTKLSSLVVKTDPWEGKECGRKDCNTCKENPDGETSVKAGLCYIKTSVWNVRVKER